MSMGGSTTSTTQIPKFLEDALKENLSRAQAEQRIGYKPYYGPDVAAMTPSQTAAMTNTGNMARSYGMTGGGISPTAGMPQAQNYGGMMAYSSGDMFDQALANLQQRRPGQYQAYTDMFINPQTGAAPMFDQNRVADALVSGGLDPNLAAGVASGDSDSIAQTQALLNSDYELALKIAQATQGVADMGPLGAIFATVPFIANKIATGYIEDTPYQSVYEGRTDSPQTSYSADRVYKDTTGLSPTGSWDFNKD